MIGPPTNTVNNPFEESYQTYLLDIDDERHTIRWNPDQKNSKATTVTVKIAEAEPFYSLIDLEISADQLMFDLSPVGWKLIKLKSGESTSVKPWNDADEGDVMIFTECMSVRCPPWIIVNKEN